MMLSPAPPPRILATRRRVLRPGMALPPGTERYTVPGTGIAVFSLAAGDRLRVMDEEGFQPGEVAAYRQNGDCDPAVLRGDNLCVAAANGTQELLTRARSAPLLAMLTDRGLSPPTRAWQLFGKDSRPETEVALTADEAATVVVAVPGGDMSAHEQSPPTPLIVFIDRIVAAQEGASPPLPPPFADPLADIRVGRATAHAYTVRAGEWIQIIDVEGRQCTDFQAFRVDALDKGAERCLDVTTTRTLNGSSYPRPGLHGKYYDYDFEPLVEVVQDNCLRHDAFGLACSAKYYDDMGYPGHINCSDNFNAALAPFGIAPRRGWMSMNFFFNTGIDDANRFYVDEPCSRPGDFVLLRALTDLVCVSSACPDDIDSANGWNPTDIHLRTYPKSLNAARSVWFRKKVDKEAEMTKETGFHPRTSALTRHLIDYNGFWLPTHYTAHGAIAEYWACREKAVVMDLSPLRKFEVLGPDAEALLQYSLTRDVRRLAEGQVVYTAMCYDNGTMIDDGTLFRLGGGNFRWIGGNDASGDWLRRRAEELKLDVRVKSSTDQLHNIAIQGPLSRDIVKEFIWTPPHQPTVEELRWFRFTIARLGGAQGIPLVLSRTGYSGELGYEIFCHPKDAPVLWDAAMQAGAPRGMIPLGLDALDMLRIESGLIFAGYEFDDQTDPYEAGIGFTVALDKREDFPARTALAERHAHPQRKLVGLELAGEEPAAHGDGVFVGRQQIGVVTSGTLSPILSKNIALVRLSTDYANAGTEVAVGKLDGHEKRLPAITTTFPFYDPEKKRPRTA